MLPQKQGEETMMSSLNQTIERDEREEEKEEDTSGFSLKSLLWHGGSVYDAWFSCASNQVTTKHKISDSFWWSHLGKRSKRIQIVF